MRAYPAASICLSLACLALTACASGRRMDRGPGADAGGQRVNPAGLMIAGCDADGSYSVTTTELDLCVARGFAAADRNGDGALRGIELADWRLLAFGAVDALPGPFAFDADQDGAITAAEFGATIRAQAANYMGDDGAIPFSALVREIDLIRGRGGDRREFDMQRPGGGDAPF
jgi:hypothetical protein